MSSRIILHNKKELKYLNIKLRKYLKQTKLSLHKIKRKNIYDLFENKNIFQNKSDWDRCSITPGTNFMNKLDKKIDKYYRDNSNAINVIYSGTMSAAIEAGIDGVPAIGFSLLDFSWDANFHPLKRFIKKITTMALKNGMPKGVVLNVNFPKLKEKEIKGVKICRQAKAYWVEDFDKRINPIGKEYYWLTGTFVNEDNEEDTDEWALKNGYVSVVPTQFDLTAHQSIRYFNKWNL